MSDDKSRQNQSRDSFGQRSSEDAPSHYVGIGASAGGLEAIESFFVNMPSDSGLAFIVIQHLSPDYKSLMVELLSKRTQMKVLRAEEGMRVRANHVYLIPPKTNLTIFNGKLLLKQQEHNTGINLPIDIFLRSLAEDQVDRAVAVILSGTGSDGTRGVRAVKEFGGMVMVQDEESAKFDGMPRAAISTGVADFILPAEDMPEQLLAFVKHPYESRNQRTERLMKDEDSMTRIFAELREKTKVDFTFYKPSTIIRRLERRLTINQIKDIEDYVSYLINYPGEVITLYRELLIGVTSFFRDPEAMNYLEEKALPDILMRSLNREIRFWVSGCSTGEEAYTLAILLREVMERLGTSRDVKIFATDVDKDAILTAGAGLYPESIAADLSPKLLSKYFYRKEDNFQVARNIREMVVFAQHNLVKDPPFTNIDLVSCRNLLIYLQPVLQQKALEMFNFSLTNEGILFLGTSETVGEMQQYFETMHQKFKIYKSKGKTTVPGQITPVEPREHLRLSSIAKPGMYRRRYANSEEYWITNRLLDLLADQYVPLAIVVNENMEILHTLGDSEGYFKLPSGRAVYDISKMATNDLAIPLATGIQKVFRNKEKISYTNIHLRDTKETRRVRMQIVPLPDKKGHEPLVAVFFEEVKRETAAGREEIAASYDLSREAQQRISDLEQDLQFTRENLQATIEELETANEELQATNEELLASNEELQSTNEELQSTNEELYTVNSEYQNKINELTELNNDVDNLLSNAFIGKLLLDEDLEVRRYSTEVAKVFRILEKDIGTPITHITHRLVDFDPIAEIKKVRETNKNFEQIVSTDNGYTYLMRILPYHIGPNTFSGVVVTFVDISELAKTKQYLRDSEKQSENIIKYMPAGFFIYHRDENGQLVLESSNPEAERMTGVTSEEYKGKSFDEIWPMADKKGITGKFLKVLETGEVYYDESVVYDDDRISGSFRVHAFRLPNDRLAVSFEDITEHKRMEMELKANEAKFRTLFETMTQGVVYQDKDGKIISSNPSAEKILGLTLDQMMGLTSMDPRWKAITEDGVELNGENHPSMLALASGKPISGFVMGVFNPHLEQMRWIMVNAIPQFNNGDDKPDQVYTTFEDITDRVLSARKLRESNERLDFAFKTAGLAWWEWDVKSGKVVASHHKAEMIGFNPDEVGDDLEYWTSRIHPDDSLKANNAMRDHLEGRSSSYTAVYRMKTKSGKYTTLSDEGRIVERDADGEPLRLMGTVMKLDKE